MVQQIDNANGGSAFYHVCFWERATGDMLRSRIRKLPISHPYAK